MIDRTIRVALAWIDVADPTDRAIALGLGSALRRAGHDVRLVGPRRRRGEPRQERLEGIPLHRVDGRGGASRLAALARELAIDVWHVHVFARDHGPFAQAAYASGWPFVATLHLVLEDYLPFVGGKDGLRRLLAGAASVATVSRSAQAELCALLPEWRRRSIVIPNGAPAAARAGPAETPYLVCPARIAPYKGQDVLLMAFAQARERVPGLRLYLCGRDQTRGALAGFARRLGLSAAVRLTGGLAPQRLAELVAGARAVVLPSRRENLPLAVLEAMAAGKAIVATRVGGVPELVRHRESALLVPPSDPRRLADALVQVCRSATLRRRLGAAARRRARGFSWAAAARRYVALYRSAVAGEPPVKSDEFGL